jgi:1-acyl-sn-glycerol-3-phosphate acyltransferase
MFGFTTVVFLFAAFLVIKGLTLIPRFLLSTRTRQGYCLLCAKAAWSATLFLSPWIRLKPAVDMDAQWKQLMKGLELSDQATSSSRPTFILGNHTSFLDTMLTVTKMPSSLVQRARTYMAEYLFKLPILSTICHAIGHFPVYFNSSKDGDFGVDREKMAQVDSLVDEHLRAGGVLCFFPEGQMNKNPDQLMPLRYGGLKKALQCDARLWSFVTYGCNSVWPRKAQLGGFPGTVSYSLRPLAPNGCVALLAELRAQAETETAASAKASWENCAGDAEPRVSSPLSVTSPLVTAVKTEIVAVTPPVKSDAQLLAEHLHTR